MVDIFWEKIWGLGYLFRKFIILGMGILMWKNSIVEFFREERNFFFLKGLLGFDIVDKWKFYILDYYCDILGKKK